MYKCTQCGWNRRAGWSFTLDREGRRAQFRECPRCHAQYYIDQSKRETCDTCEYRDENRLCQVLVVGTKNFILYRGDMHPGDRRLITACDFGCNMWRAKRDARLAETSELLGLLRAAIHDLETLLATAGNE